MTSLSSAPSWTQAQSLRRSTARTGHALLLPGACAKKRTRMSVALEGKSFTASCQQLPRASSQAATTSTSSPSAGRPPIQPAGALKQRHCRPWSDDIRGVGVLDSRIGEGGGHQETPDTSGPA
mmetsp:Transcript_102521/g.256890  ORF Transcript_102521/g.256890 Transcript_102521/m.256890 type:complete len:123 (+) Transcript_102521:149-517(+)